MERKRAIENLIVLDDEESLSSLGLDEEERVMLAATKEGIAVVPWTKAGWFVRSPTEVGHLLSFAHSSTTHLIATGHSDGVITIRPLASLAPEATTTSLRLIRRNESPVYSLLFSASSCDLFVGTAAGMPCRLDVEVVGGEINVNVKEEYAGWEAVGVECWAEGNGSVWCAGGEGGIRRY
jgi:proteasomal ATPase-associated factor 1